MVYVMRTLKALSLLGFWWLCKHADTWLPPRLQSDSMYILELADDLENRVGEIGKSYWNTAVFFNLLGDHTNSFLMALGLLVLTVYLWRIRTVWGFGLAWFLCAPAVILGMLRPQKETLVTMLALATYWLATRERWPVWLKVPLIVLAYMVYAHTFRDYYYLIAVVWLGLLLVGAARQPWLRVSLFTGGLGVLITAPVAWLRMLQEQRDKANEYRIPGEEGSRSMIENPYVVDSLGSFIGNYAHAFMRLNMPALYSRNIKDVVMNVSTLAYVYLIIRGYASRMPGAGLLTSLFVAHALVLCLFEPDLGSYFRHLSSIFLYLVPGILMFEDDVRRVWAWLKLLVVRQRAV